MKGAISFTDHQYKTAYRLFRRGYAYKQEGLLADTSWEVIQAADYSYQAKDHDVDAWSNGARSKRFHAIKHRILTQQEVRPF